MCESIKRKWSIKYFPTCREELLPNQKYIFDTPAVLWAETKFIFKSFKSPLEDVKVTSAKKKVARKQLYLHQEKQNAKSQWSVFWSRTDSLFSCSSIKFVDTSSHSPHNTKFLASMISIFRPSSSSITTSTPSPPRRLFVEYIFNNNNSSGRKQSTSPSPRHLNFPCHDLFSQYVKLWLRIHRKKTKLISVVVAAVSPRISVKPLTHSARS